jgi:uncharacterized cofD-like protein
MLTRLPRPLRWLHPGLRIKRWYGLLLLGLTLMGAGAVLLLNIFAYELTTVVGGPTQATMFGALCAVAGLLAVVVALRQLVRSIAGAVMPGEEHKLVDVMLSARRLQTGLRVVTLGGGTGLSSLLRGLKVHTSNITAIAAVSDDGGSSGRLKDDLGVPPPGDIRNCLTALADAEPLMTKLFEYRFASDTGDLGGHSFGNIFIAALTEVTGDFEQAVRESRNILAIRGSVVPPTTEAVTLCARLRNGEIIRGETKVAQANGEIDRVFLDPGTAPAVPEAIEALKRADVIIIGPGSTFTSVIPNLLVPEIAAAIEQSSAARIFVCNVMTQPGETDDYTTASKHVEAVIGQIHRQLFEYVLVNQGRPLPEVLERYARQGAKFVEPDAAEIARLGFLPVSKDIISHDNYARHDSERLAAAILEIAAQEMSDRL